MQTDMNENCGGRPFYAREFQQWYFADQRRSAEQKILAVAKIFQALVRRWFISAPAVRYVWKLILCADVDSLDIFCKIRFQRTSIEKRLDDQQFKNCKYSNETMLVLWTFWVDVVKNSCICTTKSNCPQKWDALQKSLVLNMSCRRLTVIISELLSTNGHFVAKYSPLCGAQVSSSD